MAKDTSLENMKLDDYQELIRRLVIDRGFDKETVPEVFTLLIEEIGELAKCIRKFNGQKMADDSNKLFIEEELADVFWLLVDLCNRLDINLADAFKDKEVKNSQRVWQ